MKRKRLQELRILVVEDEALIAMMIADMLADLGCVVVGIASSVAQALRVVADDGFDLAILDVNLNGVESFPAADALRRHGIPFLFATGYGRAGVPADFRDVPLLAKPFESAELERGLLAALRKPPADGPHLRA